jgi:hypothetical protein
METRKVARDRSSLAQIMRSRSPGHPRRFMRSRGPFGAKIPRAFHHMRQEQPAKLCVKGPVSPYRILLFTESIRSFHFNLPSCTVLSPHYYPAYHYVMGAFDLLPLVVLFAVVGGVAYVGYQVTYAPEYFQLWSSLLTCALASTDLPLHERTCRAWRAQAGEEERRVHKGRCKSGRKRSQC